MVAAYKGFLPIVYELHSCPHLDINHQDNDGNTALMIAAQAGQLPCHSLFWMVVRGATAWILLAVIVLQYTQPKIVEFCEYGSISIIYIKWRCLYKCYIYVKYAC